MLYYQQLITAFYWLFCPPINLQATSCVEIQNVHGPRTRGLRYKYDNITKLWFYLEVILIACNSLALSPLSLLSGFFSSTQLSLSSFPSSQTLHLLTPSLFFFYPFPPLIFFFLSLSLTSSLLPGFLIRFGFDFILPPPLALIPLPFLLLQGEILVSTIQI